MIGAIDPTHRVRCQECRKELPYIKTKTGKLTSKGTLVLRTNPKFDSYQGELVDYCDGCFAVNNFEDIGPECFDPKEFGYNSLYVAMDESGDLGKPMMGDHHFLVVGCITDDESEFGRAYREYSDREGREIKFSTDPKYREPVLKRATPSVIDVIYKDYEKDPALHLVKGQPGVDKRGVYLHMVSDVADYIGKNSDSRFYKIHVDQRGGVKPSEVESIFENNPYIQDSKSSVYPRVVPSHTSNGVGTTDFFAGSIKHMVEKKKDPRRYVAHFSDRLTELENKRSRSGKKQGKPDFHTRAKYQATSCVPRRSDGTRFGRSTRHSSKQEGEGGL